MPHANDVLNRIATDNFAKQVSTSWVWGGGSVGLAGADKTTDQIFQQMAAQGQSFFCGSGDWGHIGVTPPRLASAPIIMMPRCSQARTSRSWRNGSFHKRTCRQPVERDCLESEACRRPRLHVRSNQQHLWHPMVAAGRDMSANGGSTLMRNMPDVAMVADEILIVIRGQSVGAAGTSASSPLWAGFMALVNQQAEMHGNQPAGFINPAIYAIGRSTNYLNCFHDVTIGNNTNSLCPTNFFAVPGYDLCTGWGTPTGQPLINALADPDDLVITPAWALPLPTDRWGLLISPTKPFFLPTAAGVH